MERKDNQTTQGSTTLTILKEAPDFIKGSEATESPTQRYKVSHNLEGKCFCDKGDITRCISNADLNKLICDRLDENSKQSQQLEEKLKQLLNSPQKDYDAITITRTSLRNKIADRTELDKDWRDPTRIRSSYRDPFHAGHETPQIVAETPNFEKWEQDTKGQPVPQGEAEIETHIPHYDPGLDYFTPRTQKPTSTKKRADGKPWNNAESQKGSSA